MAVEVRFDEASGVVEMVFAGTQDPEELDAAMTRAGTLGAEMLTNRYLVDCREIGSAGSAFEVLAVAELLASVPSGVIEREAVVLPEGRRSRPRDFEFFETACRNRGLDVRVFHDRDEALAWVSGVGGRRRAQPPRRRPSSLWARERRASRVRPPCFGADPRRTPPRSSR